MNELKYWIVGAIVAFLLGLIPMIGYTAPTTADEGFCEVLADSAQVAAKARDSGVLLGQFKSEVAHMGDSNSGAGMRVVLDKMGTIVYTSEDFAGLTPDQAMRKTYRSCMHAYE